MTSNILRNGIYSMHLISASLERRVIVMKPAREVLGELRNVNLYKPSASADLVVKRVGERFASEQKVRSSPSTFIPLRACSVNWISQFYLFSGAGCGNALRKVVATHPARRLSH
jgi:hypothetical protein